MILCFELSMPNRNSWNGRWSGEDELYAKVMNLGTSKKSAESGEKLVAGSPYFYDFGDGWTAKVSVRKVDGSESRKTRRKTRGFCGYDWMIKSIRLHRRILTPDESRKALDAAVSE